MFNISFILLTTAISAVLLKNAVVNGIIDPIPKTCKMDASKSIKIYK